MHRTHRSNYCQKLRKFSEKLQISIINTVYTHAVLCAINVQEISLATVIAATNKRKVRVATGVSHVA